MKVFFAAANLYFLEMISFLICTDYIIAFEDTCIYTIGLLFSFPGDAKSNEQENNCDMTVE